MRQIIAAVLILCAASVRASDIDSIAAGRAALKRGDFDQAISQLTSAVTVNPKNSAAHYYLGLAYGRKAQKSGMFGGMSSIKNAKEEWLRAVALDPDFVDARLRLIEFYVMAPGIVGGSDEKALKQAAEMKTRDALNGHRAYAHFYTLHKKSDLAVKEMVEAVREEPKSPKAHYLLGLVLLNRGDWDRSLHEFQMALLLDAAYMPAHFRIGQYAAQSGSNVAVGEASIRKYLQYTPNDDEPQLGTAWYWLGVIEEKQGKKAEARRSYLNAQNLSPDLKDAGEALKRLP